ncbi:MAG: protein-L-isoaspartate O-methyltransferase [Candidatus Iainarchaeum archaeon]|uniref:Protein-L-isoaspartate O-methyltransferase n=1 Tax=Candidatus Iainarchaeum sp. TaxID=3101447 RepID=A0A7T9DJ38_9ARCH|nr:MAG: protein-L-isoaspartate O-methyltransferase [Candidatus Diapherotrites archaeon]
MPTKRTSKNKQDIDPTREEFVRLREGLIAYMQQTQALRSSLLTKAFLEIPREHFLQEAYRMHAYEDMSVPTLGNESTSQPRVLAQMIELLDVQEGMRVLEVGSGSGYALALLSKLVGAKGHAFGVDSNPELVRFSMKKLKELKLKNVNVVEGDGALGLEKEAPFDRILVSAAVPFVPPALFKQLKEKGHIIAPIGDSFSQQLLKMSKFQGKIIKREIEGNLYEFSPLLSKTLQLKRVE